MRQNNGPRPRSDRQPRPERGKPAERGQRGGAKSAGGGIWLYGNHPVTAALVNPERRLRRLLATAEGLKGLEPVLRGLEGARASLQPEVVTRDDIDLLLPPGAVHQGIALLTDPLPSPAVEDVVRMAQGRDKAVVMVLDQVTDPHNVGAVLRSAAAFGALAVLVPDRHAPDETGTLAKSASGALERMPLVRVGNLVRALEILKEGGFWIAGLAAEGSATLAQAKLTGKTALVLGSEGEGLRRLTREHCDYLVRLPMTDAVESLNVSNAAAVALYELVREA